MSEELKQLSNKIEELEKTVKKMSRKYSWQDKVSDTGIQLEGNATVTRVGYFLAACPVPTGPNQMTIGFVLQDDSGKIYVLPAEAVKLLTD